MRKREEDRQKKLEADSTRVLYRCAACNHFCFKLGIWTPYSNLGPLTFCSRVVAQFDTSVTEVRAGEGDGTAGGRYAVWCWQKPLQGALAGKNQTCTRPALVLRSPQSKPKGYTLDC